MKIDYDLVIGLCCYKSPQHTINLIKSADKVRGDILFYVVTNLDEDSKYLVDNMGKKVHNVKIVQGKRNSRYFLQNWGFVHLISTGVISFRYWGTMDDDTLFLESDIIEQLEKASDTGFSVTGFASSSHGYGGYTGYGDIDGYKSLCFVDGHNMFSEARYNSTHGLCDQVGLGNTSYVEAEYCMRMKILTGKPILAIHDKLYIDHLFRRDQSINDLRVPFQSRDMQNGADLFKKKYNIEITPSDVAHFSWETTTTQMNKVSKERLHRMMVYNEMIIDWSKIFKKFKQEFHNVSILD